MIQQVQTVQNLIPAIHRIINIIGKVIATINAQMELIYL